MNALNQRIRASDVDPREGPATFIEDPMREMENFESLYEQHPGRAPGGSGTTGLQSSDARGYSDMLNERLRYMRLRAMMSGEEEPTVRADPRSNFRSALVPHENDPRLPFQGRFGIPSAQGGSLSGMSSPLDALRSRHRPPQAGGY